LIPFDDLSKSLQDIDREQIADVEALLQPPGKDRPQPAAEEASRQTAEAAPTVFQERVIAVVSDVVSLRGGESDPLREGIRKVLAEINPGANLGPKGDEFWTFVTPLAPGASCLLATEIAAVLLPHFKGRFRLLVVQPLPLSLQIAYWRDQGGFILGTPDGSASSLDGWAQKDSEEALRRNDRGALVPDLGALESFLRRLVKDIDRHQVEAYVDLSPAALMVRRWSPDPQIFADELRAAVEESWRRLERYVLATAQELIVAADPTLRPGQPPGAAAALIQAWDATHRPKRPRFLLWV
jgi:hypothetical protein